MGLELLRRRQLQDEKIDTIRRVGCGEGGPVACSIDKEVIYSTLEEA